VRTRLRPREHGPQVQHRYLPSSDCGRKNTQGHHLDNYRRGRDLRRLLLLPICPAMPAVGVLLDAIYRWERDLHQPKDHSGCHLCVFGGLLYCGLDTRYNPYLPGLEFKDAEENEIYCGDDSRRWRYVSCPYIARVFLDLTLTTTVHRQQQSSVSLTSKTLLIKPTFSMPQQM
jgi:hypothetical protein